MIGCFVAGTDTSVGKTRVAAAMVRALVSDGLRVTVMKPVAAGAEVTPEGLRNDDARELIRASNVAAPYELVNPYCARLPASPHIAAAEEGIVVDPAVIRAASRQLMERADAFVVEGAGGWHAPISDQLTMADIAAALGLPVVLVVGLRLGCLSHALLTFEAIARSGLGLAGWVANQAQPHFEHARENVATLAHRLPAPLLESVSFGAPAFESRVAIDALRASFRIAPRQLRSR